MKKNNLIQDLEELPRNSVLCIYGSGEGGQRISNLLRRKRKDVSQLCFVDSFRSGKLNELDVLRLEEWMEKFSSQRPLIIVTSLYHEDICQRLDEVNYDHYAVVDLECFPTLRMRLKSFRSKCLNFGEKLEFNYERNIAPFVASNFWILYWPLYRYLKHKKLFFLANIAPGTGHVIWDIDKFLTRSLPLPDDENVKYIWVTKSHYMFKTCMRLYRSNFYCAFSNTLLYNLLCPLIMRFRDIAIDAGSTQVKWQLDEKGKVNHPFNDQTALNVLPLEVMTKQWIQCYEKRLASSGCFPMKNAAFSDKKEFNEWLDFSNHKVALIHLKERAVNAAAIVTDPDSYHEMLAYLMNHNYKIIFVGRERMPESFKSYSVVDYPRSQFVSFENDLYLFSKADVAVVCGGISTIASALDIPMLYVNSWNIDTCWWGEKSVIVPTLVERKNGTLLDIHEQVALSESGLFDQSYRYEEYFPRNASARELLEGLLELIELKKKNNPRSSRQKSVMEKFEGRLASVSGGRFSDYFLNKFPEVFLLETVSFENDGES